VLLRSSNRGGEWYSRKYTLRVQRETPTQIELLNTMTTEYPLDVFQYNPGMNGKVQPKPHDSKANYLFSLEACRQNCHAYTELYITVENTMTVSS
jgi:hypothetical protein